MKAQHLLLVVVTAASVPSRAIDLDYCVGRPSDNLTPQAIYEAFPSVDLTTSLRRSLASAEQEMASLQANRERAEQEARARTVSESASRTASYTVSSQDQRALATAVAAQPKAAKALSTDAIGQAAQIGVNAAAIEADQLIKAGSAPADAKRAGQGKGLAAAIVALQTAGVTPSPSDLSRLRIEIAGRIESAADTSGVAAWAHTTTTSVQRSFAQEQSQRLESSASRTSTASTTFTASRQSQLSESDTLSLESALSVPLKVDFNRDLFQVVYPNAMKVGQSGDTEEWRYSVVPCSFRAQIMALGGYDALQYVSPRDQGVARDVARVYEVGRTGNLLAFIPGVAALAADDRLLAKAAALLILYRIGSADASWRPSEYSKTIFPQQILEAIERLFRVIDRIDAKQRDLTGAALGVELPEQMPPLAPPPGVSSIPLTAQERYVYSTVGYFKQQVRQRIINRAAGQQP